MSEAMSGEGDRVALITGASQGIGAALLDASRRRGYAVVATSRSIEESADGLVATVRGDVAAPATAELAVATALEHFGRLDTLVNNAGLYRGKPFTDYTVEDFEAVTAVNLAGFFHMTSRAIAAMEGHDGHVVNISTTLAENANSEVPAALAALTKGGLVAATRSLAIEYAARGIRVNTVAAGVIRTPMHPEETHDTLASMHPLGRMGEISDIVDAIVYLENSPFVTGEILHVDGGQSAGH
jgi:NAD(P)-dependent dehydrogenase (short-subunit alcohol dehydrogenase family)